MHVNVMLVVAWLAVKRQQDQPKHVERSEQRRHQSERVKRVSNVAPPVFALEGTKQNRVLAKESRKWRKSRDCQSGRQHRQVSPANLFAQAAHAVHVLFAAHGMNHAARREAENLLEERMRYQVESARRKRSHAAREQHVTQLADGRI